MKKGKGYPEHVKNTNKSFGDPIADQDPSYLPSLRVVGNGINPVHILRHFITSNRDGIGQSSADTGCVTTVLNLVEGDDVRMHTNGVNELDNVINQVIMRKIAAQ